MSADEHFMQVALRLARLSAPFPNPPVGALVVLKGTVVGLGHHEQAGMPHAEAIAIKAAGELARGADLYVTLEPCNHSGRTPPCVDAVLSAGIQRVIVGCLDPNPYVRGGGAASLAAAGIEVGFGPWRAEAEALIESWRSSLRFAAKSAKLLHTG